MDPHPFFFGSGSALAMRIRTQEGEFLLKAENVPEIANNCKFISVFKVNILHAPLFSTFE